VQEQEIGRQVLYAGIGATMVRYDVDVESASLTGCEAVKLPEGAQYAWQHFSKRYLYVVTSDVGPGNSKAAADATHHLCAFRIAPDTGALNPHGATISLRHRPIHVSADAGSRHVLIAYCNPSMVTVHRINSDGTLGDEVKQAALDFGVFAHQIRVAPSNSMAILVTRGNNPRADKGEEPGALKVFRYDNGRLSDEISIAPNGGYGFGPRHLDFHPVKPWIYLSVERQNQLQLFRMQGDTIEEPAAYSKDTLKTPGAHRPRQWAGTVHVHPNGRFVYGCERSTEDLPGRPEEAYVAGENTIVAYAIDQNSGEPTVIQHIDTQGMHARTFSIDATGRLLVAANKSPVIDRTKHGEPVIPASLEVFRIDDAGKLSFVRNYDVDVGNASLWWSGMVQLLQS
jgi:6-phosphogluconolactonase (cycloisomerase 2 family)